MRTGFVVGTYCAMALAACSGSSSTAEPTEKSSEAEGTAVAAAPVVTVPAPLPLGGATLDAFAYRRGPGRASYDDAVKAEKRGDWPAVVAACEAALAADPDHLDAAWLLAAARARQGAHDQILAPLSRAIAGDWGKWGERSLTLPLFDGFRASAWGEAWATLAEQYRAVFAELAPGALVVLGRDGETRRTEVYGYATASKRWLRLSRTGGTVVAALPAPGGGLVAYVAYRDLAKKDAPGGQGGAVARPRIAVIDLATGRVSREIALADVDELRVWWKPGKPGEEPTLAIDVGGGADAGAWLLDWKRAHKKRPLAGQKLAIGKDAVIVARGVVRRRRLPVADITADWDDDGLASAIRLERTRKTVAPPAGLAIDGHSLVWSPDRARLALVATSSDDCAAPSVVFAVDAGTGKLRKLGEGAAPAPTWVDATHVAYTAGDRVRVVDALTGKLDVELASAATAIIDRSCSARDDDEVLFAEPEPDEVDDEEEADPGSGTGTGTGTGAGTAADSGQSA